MAPNSMKLTHVTNGNQPFKIEAHFLESYGTSINEGKQNWVQNAL